MDDVTDCPICAELRQLVAELQKHAAVMENKVSMAFEKLTKAETRIRQLQETLAGAKTDSTNSSKPPSSDIVKPPKKTGSGPRQRGAQPGHAPQQRAAFRPDQINQVQQHAYQSCPQCGGAVEQLATPAEVIQQAELVERPLLITEHQSYTCRCQACQQNFTHAIPPTIATAGTFGPRLMAHVAYLKGACHTSFRTIQQWLQETCGLQISTGTLAKICQRMARSLQPAYDELRRQIPAQTKVHIDETGHRDNGDWYWAWVFRAPSFTLFHIDRTRSTVVLDYLLGDQFRGTLQADFYGAYRRYLATHPLADAQFCHAHLVRDVKFLATLPDEADRQFATKLLAELRELFRLWHARAEAADEKTFRQELIAQGKKLEAVALEQAPSTKASRTLARRFRKYGDQYLRFTRVEGLDPTNNAAEQAIRQLVIDRHVTQGTRSQRGRTWCERIWSVIATCRQHGQNLLSFLEKSLLANLTDTPPPTLLPT
ncbi:MAG: IS66 family transposase [Planctomycetia bacterium]|nr:IS66 family transposase [Planctomycetia bacterium]